MLGLAGEYAACSELLRREKLVSITSGNTKATDIIVININSINQFMKAYLLQAPRDFVDAGIPKGYMIQVVSSSTGGPHGYEIAEALRRAGFNKRAESWSSPGNWIIKELK